MTVKTITLQPAFDFRGMEGVTGIIKGPMAKTANGFLSALRGDCRICSAAGDYGAVTVWIDDAGVYRGVFQVRQIDREKKVFATRAEIRPWLDIWLPKMREAP